MVVTISNNKRWEREEALIKKVKGEIKLQRIGGMLIGEFAMQYF